MMDNIPGVENPTDFQSRMEVENISGNNMKTFVNDNSLTKRNIKILQ